MAGRDVLVYTEPFLVGNTFPSDAVWSTSPGGSWVDQGWTKDGVAVRWRQQIQEYMVDQILDPIIVLPLSRDLRFVANLGQVDAAGIVTATSSGSSTGVGASGSGTQEYILNSVIQNLYFSVFFDIRNPSTNDFAHWVGWRTRGIGDLNLAVHLPDIATVAMEMRCLPDTSTSPARIANLRMQLG